MTNPGAPPGPGFMPEYVNPQLERAGELNEISDRLFDEGTDARVRADGYIRTTVVLATILFLLALSQRFHLRQVRLGVLAFSGALLVYGLITMVFLPRL